MAQSKSGFADRDTHKHLHLLVATHNAGVKRAASAAPLERLVIHAFDFDYELVF